MLTVDDVFTPNSTPVYTYVERYQERLEQKLASALRVKNSAISLVGPSKTGKTALVNKVLSAERIVLISGSQLKRAGDLWRLIIQSLGQPLSIQQTSSSELSGTVGVGVGILSGEQSGKSSNTTTKAHSLDDLSGASSALRNSKKIVFIDDFHYIDRDMQAEVARDIKAGLEVGMRFCIASVPHQSDNAIRGNNELSGRVFAILEHKRSSFNW
jgi:hypothetical protein